MAKLRYSLWDIMPLLSTIYYVILNRLLLRHKLIFIQCTNSLDSNVCFCVVKKADKEIIHKFLSSLSK
jgi:hypothetical protein